MLFNKQRITDQLVYVYENGLEQSEPRWDLGYDRLTQAFPALLNGLWYILAVENAGKSMIQLNLGYNILAHNPDAHWLDFSLDDSTEDRLGYLLARAGSIPIDSIHQAGALTDEQKAKRKAVIGDFRNTYGNRYSLIGATSNSRVEEDVRFDAESMCDMIRQARAQIGPDPRLLVTIDSFHDVELQARTLDENDKIWQKSKMFKRVSESADALFILTAHTRKNSRKRGQTADASWGSVHLAYDARIMSTLYSDVGLNRSNASVFWVDQEQPDRMMPVLELDIVKNKSGRFKDVIFFNYIPESCQVYDTDDITQQYYRGCIFNKRKGS